MTINMFYLSTVNISDPTVWMDEIPITTHELIHGLGFTPGMFASFRYPNGTVMG